MSQLQLLKRSTALVIGGTILLAISVLGLLEETNLLTHVMMDITLKLRLSGINVTLLPLFCKHTTHDAVLIISITDMLIFLLKIQT